MVCLDYGVSLYRHNGTDRVRETQTDTGTTPTYRRHFPNTYCEGRTLGIGKIEYRSKFLFWKDEKKKLEDRGQIRRKSAQNSVTSLVHLQSL
jgi:hypothetical protein